MLKKYKSPRPLGELTQRNIKSGRFVKINQWLARNRLPILIFIVLLAGLVAFAAIYANSQVKYNEPENLKVVKKTAPKFYSPLTGLAVSDEATTKRQVTAIMLENSPDARPQSGLKEAGIVYEAIAEGGITRFLVLYQESQPKIIGPVRSLRPYYVDWLAPYDASVAHVGGSAKALGEIRNGSYKDIDQFFNEGSYWRATDRYAPHNVYTNFDKLNALNSKKGNTDSNFTGFARKNDNKSKTPNASNISVPISSATFNSGYTYDPGSNSYNRQQAGAAHTDREEGQIAPKVVIILQLEKKMVQEDGWRESYQTTGSGRAWIFQDGTVQEASWSKASTKAPLSLLDANSQAIKLNAGQTWITALEMGKLPTWQ